MMAATLIIAYPKGSNFNLKHYTETHMPVAWKAWQPLAKSYKVSVPAADSPSPYEVILSVEWNSMEDFTTAIKSVPEETTQWMTADVPKYSQKPPVVWTQLVQEEMAKEST
jgi:uncharacterized protein (TIGR02118 family)